MNNRALLLHPKTSRVNSFVPLGLAYISAVLKENNWDTKIIDLSAPNANYGDNCTELINNYCPKWIGISVTTLFFSFACDLINALKVNHENIPIICGGPHATISPDDLLNEGADIVVIGEGEQTIKELLEFFNNSKKLSNIRGIAYKYDNRIVRNDSRELIKDINSISFPLKESFAGKDYFDSNSEKYRFGNIITSRGCPYNCNFCSKSIFGNTFRYRSANNIISEMNELNLKYGLSSFDFIDDAFSVYKQRVVDLCNKMIDMKLNYKWSCVTRIDIVDNTLLKIMKRAGCIKINFGIESVNEDTIAEISKGIQINQINDVVYMAKNLNIDVSINMMWGFPWENEDSVIKSRKFMLSFKEYISDIDPAGILIPFPDTRIYKKYKDKYEFNAWWKNRTKFTGSYRDKARLSIYRIFGFDDHGVFEANGFFNYSETILNELKIAANDIAKFNIYKMAKHKKLVLGIFLKLSKKLYIKNHVYDEYLTRIFYQFIKIYRLIDKIFLQ